MTKTGDRIKLPEHLIEAVQSAFVAAASAEEAVIFWTRKMSKNRARLWALLEEATLPDRTYRYDFASKELIDTGANTERNVPNMQDWADLLEEVTTLESAHGQIKALDDT